MNCETSRESIALALYGELSAEEHRALDAHLASCEACRDVERAYAGTVGLLRRASPRLPSRPRIPRLWRAAAVAAVLVAAVVLVARSAGDRPPNPAPRPSDLGLRPSPVPPGSASVEVRLSAIEREGSAVLGVADEDFLGALSASPDASLAFRAISALGRRGTPRVEGALRAALAAPATRAAAFDALAALGRLDAMRDAVPALADPALRRRAAEALRERGTREASEALLARAAKGDRACLAACGAFRPEAALPSLRAALSDEARREAAVELLLTADGDAYREALLAVAASDDAVRAVALERARSTASGTRFLVLALCNGVQAEQAIAGVPVRELREAVAKALRDEARRAAVVAFLPSRSDEAAARDLLASALAYEDVRPTAGAALLARGDLRGFLPLLRGGTPQDLLALSVLDAETRRRELSRALGPRATRVAALRAIRPGDDALWRDVVPCLRDERTRPDALAALARIEAHGAIPYLIPYVSKSEEGRLARSGLVSIVGEDLGEDPREWKAWWRSQTN